MFLGHFYSIFAQFFSSIILLLLYITVVINSILKFMTNPIFDLLDFFTSFNF